MYGLIICIYTIIQQFFSILNNNYLIPKLIKKAKKIPLTNIQVVGYLEDPKLFFSCLTSLSQQ